ncbi:HD domain-containing phosphohydrolase [Methylomonas sp. AM2-LC]|uniref:GAF and HD-GYP domain-containing protein n=1 Tax=Methylomonas sp. AM2-LC TaxID=3153301 RepID=UPI003263FCEF
MTDQNILAQLEMLIDIGIALSDEHDVEILLEKILLCAKSITAADGGTLYRIEENNIVARIIHSESLKIHLGGSSENAVNLPKMPLYHADGSINLSHVVCYSFHKHCVVNIPDVYSTTDDFDFSGPKQFDKQYSYVTKSLLTIPLKNHKGQVIGVLQLVNALDPTTKTVIGFNAVSQKITTAMAAQAAIVLTQQQLIIDLENLFQSLVKLIATAIDKKSPYTGAHSKRVPILTMMLADAVHETDDGLFKDFSLSPADRKELEVAAWLHDCGKITTPEFVMDKATKLETIFDRIQLIETRFEVLKRDKEIAMLKQKVFALENNQLWDIHIEQQFNDMLSQIEMDLAFIKHSNFGTESMSANDQERIHQLSQVSWKLHQQVLPLLSEDEVNNLCIFRGTLTDKERKIINNHINATIDMLESINFPTHLKNVPEFAGGHHERMDGKGYPKGLRREQMSVQARIMGIADVFEALMDADRPYKKGKKLSEALAILKSMKENGHIDPDLYEVFIDKKVYKHYVDLYVPAEQIDVD